MLSQQRSAENRWVRSAEYIIVAPVGIEELPSQAEEHREGGQSAEWDRGAQVGIEELPSQAEEHREGGIECGMG